MSVAAVGRADAVAVLEHARHSDGDRLLARVEVGRAVDLAPEEERLDEVLEPPDQDHRAVEAEIELGLAADGLLAGVRHARSFDDFRFLDSRSVDVKEYKTPSRARKRRSEPQLRPLRYLR
jgi:hypothetical protein